MSLSRNSFWTLSDGQKVRVIDMTSIQILRAINHLDDLYFNEITDDPYLIETFCQNNNCCNVSREVQHKVDGYLIEDWHNLLSQEWRIRQVSPKRPRTLVKLLKFW